MANVRIFAVGKTGSKNLVLDRVPTLGENVQIAPHVFATIKSVVFTPGGPGDADVLTMLGDQPAREFASGDKALEL